jgi:hypothetical protein
MRNVYREVNGNVVRGKSFPALVLNDHDLYVLDEIEVYQDEVIICQSIAGDLPYRYHRFAAELSLDDVVQAVVDGILVTTVPEGRYCYRFGLAAFLVVKIESEVEQPEDYVLMIHDILREFRGEPTSSERCLEALYRFLREPTPFHHEQLRLAYEAVPSPKKGTILRDPDNAEAAITAIIVRDVATIDQEWLQEQRDRYFSSH